MLKEQVTAAGFWLKRLTRRPRLIVPEEFNRNSSTVRALMTPEQSGLWLLERMRRQLGLDSYTDRSLLDFGCGVRFTQAIINSDFPIGRYFGVDNHRPLIEFLQKNVRDPRFRYQFLDAYHPLYNPHGNALAADTELDGVDRDFDIVAMFSVITHQYPEDSERIFTALRRHVRANGNLFFTCFLDEKIATFEDRSPERNAGRCFYNTGFLTDLVERCGWRVIANAPSEGPLIGDSFVCRPDSSNTGSDWGRKSAVGFSDSAERSEGSD